MKEKLWRSLAPWTVLVSGFAAMFAAAAYVAPALVGYPADGERQGFGQAVEVGCLFGGLLLGFVVGAVAIGSLERRLFPPQIRAEWRRQDQKELEQVPPLLRGALRVVDRLMGK